METPLDLHVTCPDEETAMALATAALEKRLVACANLFGPVRSVFHWQGKVESDTEWLLTCKTHSGVVEDLVTLLREAHPYDLPVITWHEMGMEPDAAAWLRDETGA